MLQNVMEEVSGGRMHYMFNRVGGLKEDLPGGLDRTRACRRLRRTVPHGRLDDLVSGNEIFRGAPGAGRAQPRGRARVRGQRPDRACLGRRLRSAPRRAVPGVRRSPGRAGGRHPRRAATASPGSACLLAQTHNALDLAEACLDRVAELHRAGGPINQRLPKVLKAPEGHTYAWTENPLGINGYYLVSKGEKTPYRLKLRSAWYNDVRRYDTIARELHDVVAHNVSVMVVQADGAAYVLDAAPDQAKKALETISTIPTGRQALAEMRRLLGVLRTGEHQEAGEYIPGEPDVQQIEDLVEQCRGSGLPVDFKVEGTPRPLPSGVELTAYRIVQEALTNTRKHAGPDPGAGASRLVYFDDGLGLLVEDDGKGAPHELYEEGGFDGRGHGLIGMRERVGMVGGTLDAGPRPGGGFRISALLPLKPAH
ncbi:NAD(P)H-quinone oxidoreductase subunit H, chloroplastic [Streptomyces fumanus]